MGRKGIILGAGVTGLTAGMKSALPVYEAEDYPGGICASYSVSPGQNDASISEHQDEAAYKFSIGGGHWIFGSDRGAEGIIKRFSPVKSIERKSAVYFPHKRIYAAYPIQNNVKDLGGKIPEKVSLEMSRGLPENIRTMEDWLKGKFGPTLFRIFFGPFHKLYTAGLYKTIAPQDLYKSPSSPRAIKSAGKSGKPSGKVGYNASFIQPKKGLPSLIYGLAKKCRIHFNKRALRIDIKRRGVFFEDGSSAEYDSMISTIPLNKMLGLTGLRSKAGKQDPYTSVLVLNIGAIRGDRCPELHWLYVPSSKSGFFRVGFYSNVDVSFLPTGSMREGERVSIYVERAFPGSSKPSEDEIRRYSDSVVRELRDWGFIKKAEVVHPTWIDVAYTWSWPGSAWRDRAISTLGRYGICQTGRYGLWRFQGITESIRQGLRACSKTRLK